MASTATSRNRPKPGTAPRRQRVPPALTRGNERFDGLGLLHEQPGDLGVVLWRSVRNVQLWAGTPADRRARLFAGEAGTRRAGDLARLGLDPELQGPLSVIVSLLDTPARVDVPRLVNA
ncbi:MAG TPA: hypothetical protein VFX98_15210, partial [Longimicrobiaceae bacterium]|nr:hypothetical protein [Longimicrobiaceae bacterium]